MLVHGGELRPTDREKVKDYPEHKPGVVEPERPEPEALAERRPVGGRIAQAEVDQADGEQAEGRKEGGMGMVQRQERAVLVIIDQWRVERAAAEDAGAGYDPDLPGSDPAAGSVQDFNGNNAS